jgi:competence protein ComFC
MDFLRSAGEFAIDLVYPKRCAGCGTRGSWLCTRCDAGLTRFLPPWCPGCGVPLALNRCQCERMPEALFATRSVGPFDGWLRNAIVQYKYHGEWARAEPLALPLANAIGEMMPCDALVPVPLHTARFRQRGFNQSQLLARHAARHLGIEVREAVVRSRHSTAQATLSAAERRPNVDRAFAVCPTACVEGMSLILIDDVITTGSTLAACADVLLAAGAKSVSAGTVAREL